MTLTPQQLDLMRRSTDLRLDAEGELLHEGTPILHPGLHRLFHQGLDVAGDGAPIVRVGDQFAYLRTPGTPFVVRTWRVRGPTLSLGLNTGESLKLTVSELGLTLYGEHTLVLILASGRKLRLGRRAWTQVSADLSLLDDGKLTLAVAGHELPVAQVPTTTGPD